MNFLFGSKKVPSTKNGEIVVENFFGHTYVVVDGCYQSSSSGAYISTMWKTALKKIISQNEVPKVLLLGLGAGNVISLLQKKYKQPKITVIEWDNAMISVAEELHFYKQEGVHIICDDALVAVPNLQETYDLIVVDLFTGDNPEPRLKDGSFVQSLSLHLKENGSLLLNVYREKVLLQTFSKILTLKQEMTYKHNSLALYTNRLE